VADGSKPNKCNQADGHRAVVLGSTKVVPRRDGDLQQPKQLGIYMQVLQPEATKKPQVQIHF